ncbi:MAG: hypothetical protein DME44_03795 [Verrucomicrobia bacterium]|nr:MAG: hypothetical protein DME44_03795 [Verrucomicrobiota bacterium]
MLQVRHSNVNSPWTALEPFNGAGLGWDRMEPYQPRAFRVIELCRSDKWQMKFYGIACQGEFPRTELFAGAGAQI